MTTSSNPILIDSSDKPKKYYTQCPTKPKISDYYAEKFYESQREDFIFSKEGSEIVEFFKQKCVLVTGATGFFGKLLVEKLLRTCDGIETIYILIRDKKGKDINDRMDELYSDIVFSKLARQQPKFRHKIVAIRGDVGLPDVGISPQDRELIKENVSVIFHGAATVRFDEHIKKSVLINVRGTKEMLNLARECPKLQSFVHVSTAYANCVVKEIDEVFYKTPYDTDAIISIVNAISEGILTQITPELVGKYPNTYAFTKAIGEQTVNKYGQGLPVCVYRPSVVMSTYKEPLRNWIDNVYGATGVAVGSGLGLIRTLKCDKNVVADLVPGDLVINGMIAASYKNAVKQTNDIAIYNYVSSVENPITWGTLMGHLSHYGLNVPSVRAIWYYNLNLTTNIFVYWFYVIFLHYTTALVLDGASLVLGKKPQLVKAYKKIQKFSNVISYFCLNEWKFHNDNVQKLWAQTSSVDRKLFPFCIKDLDWNYFNEAHMLGLRVYIAKDDVSTLPEGRKWAFRLKILHYAVKYLAIFFALRLVYWVLSSMFSTVFH